MFDSWHQEDTRLNRKVALNLLDNYNFKTIIDIGSGKGALTHQLKKLNNNVIGIDISPSAVDIARARFPDICFEVVDVNNLECFQDFLAKNLNPPSSIVDLVFTAECLSYVKNWKELISWLRFRTRYLLIVLYIPEDPIGFVKSSSELEAQIASHFHIHEVVSLNNRVSL